MALLPCPECAQNVSTEALACPHCGYPIKAGVALSVAVPEIRCSICPRPATTRCQKCDSLSCAEHVFSTTIGNVDWSQKVFYCANCRRARGNAQAIVVVIGCLVVILVPTLILAILFWLTWLAR
jgi:hypothetical protein